MHGLWAFLPLVIFGVLAIVAVWWARRSQQRRQAELADIAEHLALMFFPDGDSSLQVNFGEFSLMQRGRDQRIRNLIRGETEQVDVNLFDYRYVTGSGKHRTTHQITAVTFVASSLTLPQFELGPEGILHKIASSFGYQDIDFAGHPEFNKRFLLRGANEKAIRKLFTVDVVEHFEGQSHRRRVEGYRDRLLIYSESLVKPADVPEFLEQAFATYGVLKHKDVVDSELPPPEEDSA
jgi:hypothetical protein